MLPCIHHDLQLQLFYIFIHDDSKIITRRKELKRDVTLDENNLKTEKYVKNKLISENESTASTVAKTYTSKLFDIYH